MLQGIRKIVEKIENSKTSFFYYLITFLTIITIRNGLEYFSSPEKNRGFTAFMHASTFYFAIILTIILLLYLFTKQDIIKITKLILAGSAIILIVPVIDLMVDPATGQSQTYLLPNLNNNLWTNYFTLGGPYDQDLGGITLGIKIELTFLLIFFAYYIYLKTDNLYKSILGSICIYSFMFVYAISPYINKYFFHLFNLQQDFFDNYIAIRFFLIIFFIQVLIYLYIGFKQNFLEFIKNLRWLRLILFFSVFLMGLLIPSIFEISQNSVSTDIELTTLALQGKLWHQPVYEYVLVFFTIILAAIPCIILNDLFDQDIDRISNQKRPLITGTFSEPQYIKIAIFSLLASLVYAYSISDTALFLFAFIIATYTIYSSPPIRLKRVPVISKMIISINLLAMLMLGFSLASDVSLIFFPKNIILFMIIPVTLAANFIDIKDYQGDKKAGVETLVTLIGKRWSKIMISTFFVIMFSFLPFILKKPDLFIYSSIPSLLFLYLFNKKKYKEKNIFLLTFVILIIIILKINF